ncbi:MAG: hypothetical protein FGM15_11220 [Chthoniobacterales bacterium]|nr:hypothetical protein [Chthoniobacterales bacterium]
MGRALLPLTISGAIRRNNYAQQLIRSDTKFRPTDADGELSLPESESTHGLPDNRMNSMRHAPGPTTAPLRDTGKKGLQQKFHSSLAVDRPIAREQTTLATSFTQ